MTWLKEAKSMLRNLPNVPKRFVVKHLAEIVRLPFVRSWEGAGNGDESSED